MKRIKNYYVLLLTSFILLMLGFFIVGKKILDINIHDTYFIILYSDLYLLFSIIAFFFFTIYFSLDKGKIVLNDAISKIHIFGTLFSILVLLFPYSLFENPKNFQLYDSFEYINMLLTISFLLFLIFQLLFIINIFVSLIKKMKSLRTSK